MEWIVNFFNSTVDIGSWLISCIAIYVVSKFQSSKVWCIFTRPRRKNVQERKIKGT